MTNSKTLTLAQQLGFTADDADQLFRMGADLAGAGQLDEARIMFEGVLALNPRDAAACASLGAVRQEQGAVAEAEKLYDQALTLDPSTPVARLNRGELRLRRGDKRGLDDLRVVADVGTAIGRSACQLMKQHSLARTG